MDKVDFAYTPLGRMVACFWLREEWLHYVNWKDDFVTEFFWMLNKVKWSMYKCQEIRGGFVEMQFTTLRILLPVWFGKGGLCKNWKAEVKQESLLWEVHHSHTVRDRGRGGRHVNHSHLLLIQLVFQTTGPADPAAPGLTPGSWLCTHRGNCFQQTSPQSATLRPHFESWIDLAFQKCLHAVTPPPTPGLQKDAQWLVLWSSNSPFQIFAFFTLPYLCKV